MQSLGRQVIARGAIALLLSAIPRKVPALQIVTVNNMLRSKMVSMPGSLSTHLAQGRYACRPPTECAHNCMHASDHERSPYCFLVEVLLDYLPEYISDPKLKRLLALQWHACSRSAMLLCTSCHTMCTLVHSKPGWNFPSFIHILS